MQKNQLIELREHFERYCKELFVSGSNGAKYDLNLIKCYLLPTLVNERDTETTVINKTNQFISFKLSDFQLRDVMNFLDGTAGFDSFL